MITKRQRSNARTIVTLADEFGRLAYNEHGQTVEATLNLSIPCARLVVAGVVTAVQDTADGINDDAAAEVRELCKRAVAYTTERHGAGWWNERASCLL